jgi:hypothetical protein
MTKQNKNVKKRTLAKAITALHLRGEKAAASTTPQHGKKDANRLYTKNKRGSKDSRQAIKKSKESV